MSTPTPATADPTSDLTPDPTINPTPDPTINPTPDPTNTPTTNHFQLWVSLAIFSAVSLVSMTNFFGQRNDLGQDHSHKDWTKDQRAVVSVAIISLALSVYGSITHWVNKDKFSGTNFEFGLLLPILVLWCGVLPTIMDSDHELAVSETGEVRNHNMFFASWGALIVTLMLFTKSFRRIMKYEGCHKNMSNWMGLCAASLTVMSESCRLFNEKCHDDWRNNEDHFCCRNVFGLVLGAISFLLAGTAACIPMPAVVENCGAFVLAVAWWCAFAYLTFEDGTALTPGTIYFGIWAILFFSMNMVVPLLYGMFDVFVPPPVAASGDEEAPAPGKAPVEEEEEEVPSRKTTGGAAGNIDVKTGREGDIEEEEEIASE